MTGAPATGAICVFDIIGSQHDGQFNFVVGIHFATIDKGCRCVLSVWPLEAHVKVVTIVSTLHLHRETTAFTWN